MELAERFEQERPRLRALAYRMLGSLAEAEDAVQDAWLRLGSVDPATIENLEGWLTTVVARICLNVLRGRREQPFEIPDPIVSTEGDLQPEDEALLAESVGLALQIVLDTLSPAERLAFVLHDMFELPFDEIAAIAGRTPEATRQLASRARRRVKDVPTPDPDVATQRRVVDAFYSAARAGDMERLVALLDPNVVLRTDFGTQRPAVPTFVRGAEAVAEQAKLGARPTFDVHPALINGAAGTVITTGRGRPFAVMSFNVVDGKIVAIDVIVDPGRVERVAAQVLNAS
jgi:RNA polymerase sigma factor (sigma-70 family)